MGTPAPAGVKPWGTGWWRSLVARSGWRAALFAAVVIGALVVVASAVSRPFLTQARSGRAPTVSSTPSVTPASEPRTVVSLTFNGGTPNQYRLAGPLLRRHGFNATFYLPTGRVDRGEACCMSWRQARDLYADGDEIGGTGLDDRDLTVPYSANPARDYAVKKRQICAGRQRLSSLGLDPRSFAYPAGAYRYQFTKPRRTLTQLVRSCGYSSARIVGGLSEHGDEQANAIPPAKPYVVRTPDETSGAPVTLGELQHPVLVAARSPRSWVPLVLDEVCSPSDPQFEACMSLRRSVDASVLAEFLDWLQHSGQPGGAPAGTIVRTVRQVMGAPPQPPPARPRTIVSLTFDDGDATQQLAGDILRAHRMHATFFLNTGPIDQQNSYYLTWAQVLALKRDGNEIGGHTLDHQNLTDSRIPLATRRDQVCKDRDRLLAMGLDARSFAYPEGAVNPLAEGLPRACGYRSARTAGGVSPNGPLFAEHLPPQDPFATAALDEPEGTDVPGGADRPGRPLLVDDLRRAVVAAAAQAEQAEQDVWVQIVLHRICSSISPQFVQCMSGQNPMDDHGFAAFLDWLQDGAPPGTVVLTVSQAMAVGERARGGGDRQ